VTGFGLKKEKHKYLCHNDRYFGRDSILMAVPGLKHLLASLSLQTPRFSPRQVFVTLGKVASECFGQHLLILFHLSFIFHPSFHSSIHAFIHLDINLIITDAI